MVAEFDEQDSPVSNNGRGLKPVDSDIRFPVCPDSPVSNNGRGLKPVALGLVRRHGMDSPVSNNGRGLKPVDELRQVGLLLIRPLAITGVD